VNVISKYGGVECVTLEDGIERRVLNRGGGMMLVEFRFESTPELPTHAHPHEQIGYILAGEFEVVCGETRTKAGPGDSYYVPPEVQHGVKLLTERGAILDAFTPQREDFLE
jgi:quercetin dioxygenase-like cupin family protein